MNIPTTTTTTPKATTLQSAGLTLSVSSVFGVMDQDVREVSGQEKELREMVPGFLISEYFTGIVFSLRKFVHTNFLPPLILDNTNQAMGLLCVLCCMHTAA